MTASFSAVVLDYVCPSIGVVLATLTFSAPVSSVRAAARNGGCLTSLPNPTPFAFMSGNTLGWLAYSFLTLDPFVFLANAPGLMISLWLNASALQVLGVDKDSGGGRHKRTFLSVLLAWLAVASAVCLIPLSRQDREDIVGVAANINLAFFYGAPLSTIGVVVRTRDSSSIHRRTLVLNTVNAAFWAVYGLAIVDPFIFIPNGTGVLLGVAQAVLCGLFPRGGGLANADVESNEQELGEELLG